MTNHWTLKLATLALVAGVIGATAVPKAQGGAARTVWDGVYSEPQAARGKAGVRGTVCLLPSVGFVRSGICVRG